MRRSDRKLLDIFRKLPEAEASMLLSFAEFLSARADNAADEVAAPKAIPRPENETVVGALKRLSESYFMLDKSRMLNDTSMLVAEHVMSGRPAEDIIDELEAVFRRHYEALIEGQS